MDTSPINSNKERFVKIIGIIGFIFIILVLITIITTPPASGYEISIYDAYPWYFWFFICISITCGILILTHQAFVQEKSRWWSMGIFIIIFANLIIILLPIFRGYFISDLADEVSHLGMIKDIVLTGHAGNSNYYPVSHILSSELSYICGLNSRFVIKIIPTIFYLIYMIGLYLFARAIGKKFGQVLLVMAFGSVLLFTYFNYLFLPTHLFLCLIPPLLMLFYKKITSCSLGYATIFVIMLLPMPFIHPLGSLFLVILFLIFGVSILIHHFLVRWAHAQSTTILHSPTIVIAPALIVFIIFFMWFSYFAIFESTVRQAYEWFIYGHGTPPIETMSEQLQRANFGFYDFIDLLIKTYGHDVLFVLLSLIAVFIILRKVFSSKSSLKVEEILFSLVFSAFSLFYISTLVGSFISTGRSLRIFCWALMASTILNGIVFHEQISRLRDKKFKACVGILTIIIILSAIIGIFSVYHSPHIKQANLQVTKMDWNGMEWFFNYKNPDTTIYINQLPYRASHAIFGFDAPKPETRGAFSLAIPHFGYNGNETLAHSYNSDVYLVITGRDKAFYTKLWPKLGRFILNDFDRVDLDSAVNKIYFNGELEIWKISTIKK